MHVGTGDREIALLSVTRGGYVTCTVCNLCPSHVLYALVEFVYCGQVPPNVSVCSYVSVPAAILLQSIQR